MISQRISILPPPPPYLGTLWGGCWGGVKTSLRIAAAVCGFKLRVRGDFFFVHGRPNPWRGSRV